VNTRLCARTDEGQGEWKKELKRSRSQERSYSGILPASTGSLQFLLSHEVILYKKDDDDDEGERSLILC